MHGVRQIRIGAGDSRQAVADGRQNAAEVERVELAEQASGFAEVENTEFASGSEDTVELVESSAVVGEVAKAEGRGDEVDGVVGERQIQGIGFDDYRSGGRSVAGCVEGGEFRRAADEHLMREVHGDHRLGVCGAVTEQGQGHVSGTTANIKDDGLGVGERLAEATGGAPPPQAVDVQ